MRNKVKPAEDVHNFRCNDRLWALATKRAKELNEPVSEVIRRALTEYVTK